MTEIPSLPLTSSFLLGQGGHIRRPAVQESCHRGPGFFGPLEQEAEGAPGGSARTRAPGARSRICRASLMASRATPSAPDARPADGGADIGDRRVQGVLPEIVRRPRRGDPIQQVQLCPAVDAGITWQAPRLPPQQSCLSRHATAPSSTSRHAFRASQVSTKISTKNALKPALEAPGPVLSRASLSTLRDVRTDPS